MQLNIALQIRDVVQMRFTDWREMLDLLKRGLKNLAKSNEHVAGKGNHVAMYCLSWLTRII
jgi:hypothetical protein